MMTASITAFGLIPLLFATGRARKSSARLHCGDRRIVTATALTLMVLPILYICALPP